MTDLCGKAGCCRLSVVTTNGNLHVLRFYQKRGFILKALYAGSILESRYLKPSIPLIGLEGILLRDEILLGLRF